VRVLVISDTHFGAWTAEPLLPTRVGPPQAWLRALENLDELVLLGDVVDLLFSSVENAFAQAD
jgi:predicted phosphodiesterase